MSDASPPDPRRDRYVRLAQALRATVAVAVVLAAATVVSPAGGAGDVTGGVLVAVLVAAPLLRVLWFVQRWFRRGDPRFGWVGTALLAVVAVGAALA